MKRVLGFSFVTVLILACVHVVANPKTPAKTSTKVVAAKATAKKLPTCPTCTASDTFPPNDIPPGREVPGVKHNYTRCVDFDNVAPGHCCTVVGQVWTVVSFQKPYNTVGVFITYNCKNGAPGPVACGTPTNPPYMANPVHISQQQYWQNFSVGKPHFALPYFRKSLAKATGNEQCKCSVPDTK